MSGVHELDQDIGSLKYSYGGCLQFVSNGQHVSALEEFLNSRKYNGDTHEAM